MKQPPGTNHMQEQELCADRENKPAPASLRGRCRCKRPSSWLIGFLPVMAFFITKSHLLRKPSLMEDFLKSVFSLMTDRVVQESQDSYALVYVVRAGETEFHQQAVSRACCGQRRIPACPELTQPSCFCPCLTAMSSWCCHCFPQLTGAIGLEKIGLEAPRPLI